jgi:hypothetical protein
MMPALMSAIPGSQAANDGLSRTVVALQPARFVTIDLAEVLTGLTQAAIRTKIQRGIWLEDRQWVKRDGRVMIDLEGYEKWAKTGVA